jgi:hypothetical protein
MAPAWWRRYLDWRLRNVRRLALEDDGFAVMARNARTSVRWDDIRHVGAFKRDLYTVDLLCLVVATPAGIVEIDEDMQGYPEVEAALCARLGIGPDWRGMVLFPPFAANPTSLFGDAA